MKIQKKNWGDGEGVGSGGGGGSGWGVSGCQGGWERRTEAFVKTQKKKFFWRGGRVGGREGGNRVDVNGEVKLL